MLNVPTEWEVAKIPADDERRVLVERIIASKRFRRAPQLRDILVYVVAHTLSHDPPTITEQEIGSTVLGRGPDFDPGHDNIVRAQMRHLRIKLGEYFENDGKDEPLILSIPKGHYVASFTPRPPATPKPVETADPAPVEAQTPPAAPNRRFRLVAAAVVAAAILAVLVFLSGVFGSASGTSEEYAFYSDILGPADGELSRETSLVLGNPVVILYAGSPTADGEAIGAGDGIQVPDGWQDRLQPAANRADLALPHRLLQIKHNDYTGLGDASGCFHLGQLMTKLARPATVTQARFLSWDWAMRRTLIILGSPHTNAWAHGNVPNHNFRIVKLGIQNNDPRPGEPELYRCVWDEDGVAVLDHGIVWSWRTPSGSRVLVLAGPSSAATGAMAAMFANPDNFRPLYERIDEGSEGGEFPSNWQALFKIQIRDNLPVRTTYLTHRIYPLEY